VLSFFLALVALVGMLRLVELSVSRRHARALSERGARAVPEPRFPLMVALHVAILGGSALEAWLVRRAVPAWLVGLSLLVVVGANVLRIWAIRSLGRHWNVKVVDSTFLGVVRTGPYRFVRHPNYAAVFLELLFLPLVGGAFVTAAFGSLLHALVLRRRIALEESVLSSDPAYQATVGKNPRFVPRLAFRTLAGRAQDS
jgi:methyltransferase